MTNLYLPTVVPRDLLNGSVKPTQLTVAADNAPLRVVYGQVRTGPQIATVVSYIADKGYIVILAIWCDGEIESITNVYLDDKPITAAVDANHYTGTQTQNADPLLVTAFAAQAAPITYTDNLRGICYSVFRLVASTSKGFPRFTAAIKGRKVYDPRTSTTAWSDNPALCVADFTTNTTYGMSRTGMDWSSVSSVASDNDSLIGVAPNTEKSRTLNLILEAVQPAQNWLDTLRTYAACWVIPVNSGFKLVSDKASTTIAAAFSHASGNIHSLTDLNKRGVQDIPTILTVNYTDTSAIPYRDRPAVVPEIPPLTRRESQVSLPGITRYSQAYREATERLNKLKLNDLSLNLGVFDEALSLEVGDLVTVTHPIGIAANKPFRVMSITGDYGRFILNLVEYDPLVYSSAVALTPTFADTLMPNPFTLVSSPTALVVTEEVYKMRDGAVSSRFVITWQNIVDFYPVTYWVSISDPTHIVASGYVLNSSYTHGPLKDGETYTVKVYAEREESQVRSQPVITNKTALGKVLKPANVATLTHSYTSTGVQLSWSSVTDIDMKGYTIQETATWVVGGTTIATTAQNITTINIGYASVGVHFYGIKAIDWSGNESINAIYTSITVAKPSTPSPSAVISGPNVVISWPASIGSYLIARYEIRVGTVVGTLVATLSSLETTLRVPIGIGALKYYVVAYDVAGNQSLASEVSLNITAPALPVSNPVDIQVIDNNVMLRWLDATQTLPIDRYEIRKGATWETGVLFSTVSARFSTLFESYAGTYSYWIVAYDSAGNASVPKQTSATVAQPPDFILLFNQNSSFSGTKVNCAVLDGSLIAPINATETFEQHFVNNAWTTPQAQITAGYPRYIEPDTGTGSYSEIFDNGVTVGSTTVTLSVDHTFPVGAVTITPYISVSNISNTGPWTDFASSSQIHTSNFRWVKVRYDFSTTVGAHIISISRININMSFKLREDAGMADVFAADVAGTIIPLNLAFVDVTSIQVSPVYASSGSVPVTAVYDFNDIPNPPKATGFKVLLFNQSGVRVNGRVSWSVKGV